MQNYKRPMPKLKETYAKLKETYITLNVDLCLRRLKETYVRLKETYVGLQETYISLNSDFLLRRLKETYDKAKRDLCKTERDLYKLECRFLSQKGSWCQRPPLVTHICQAYVPKPETLCPEPYTQTLYLKTPKLVPPLIIRRVEGSRFRV